MLSQDYIDPELIIELDSPIIRNGIYEAYANINSLNDQLGDDIMNLLKLMTQLYCYKISLEMNVVGSVVPDVKDPEHRYVQARAAVKDLKNKRMWISQYLGVEKNYTNNMGGLIQIRVKNDGRKPLVEKTVAKLLEQVNEL